MTTSLSEKVTSLWLGSTTTLPRIFSAAECWDEEHLPSTTKLIVFTLHHIEATKKVSDRTYYVYRQSEQAPTVDPRLAIAQLVQPAESGPVVLIDLDIIPKGVFHIPVSLAEFIEGTEEANQQLLLTPNFSFTDLHVDTSNGISSPIGKCKKLWMVFPPTVKNIGLMKRVDGQRAKLTRIGRSLEGGLVFTTNSNEAIYLPAACIHAVITFEGGYLIAIDFVTPLSSRPLSTIVDVTLDASGAANTFREEVMARFLVFVDYGMSCKFENLAIASWIATLENINRYAKDFPNWKRRAIKIWDDFFMQKKGGEIICAYGDHGKGNFIAHFKEVHMWQKPRVQKRTLGDVVEGSVVEKQPTRKSKIFRIKT
ncbi:uncharacterized protein RSE6_04150 [Rhynchosporium secalis]|uniref:JmjC domain-containing protein n=1 Tax=Rhynchosporium secalis TaxID=38038 RepID=A0A1E1M4J4_RHYSE|nr:uncharacterized protein RSE6_04150 [Rhynchosporium secalis]